MGVMPNMFSSDSRDCERTEKVIEKMVRVNSTPDPTNFEVKSYVKINGYPIFWVNYPDVTNYEGDKILMYPKHFNTDLLQDRMDPHFFNRGDSPLARFEPTPLGWQAALTLAENF